VERDGLFIGIKAISAATSDRSLLLKILEKIQILARGRPLLHRP